jgi:hypothetical protein
MNVTEKVDLRKIQYLKSLDFKAYKLLAESKKADKDQKVLFDNLQKYCNEMIKGKGEFIRTYHHTLSTPLEAGGRMFCAGAIQGFPKNIRGYLFGDTTTDIDMKNAHPTILRFICRVNKILTPQLASYIENRDDVLNMVSDRDELKEIFLKSVNDDKPVKKSVLNKYSKELQKIIKDFDDEMKTIQSKVISLPQYKSCVDTVPSNRLYNFNGSAINRILCYEEDKILKIMVNYLASKQIQLSALMFDGCMPYGNFYDDEDLIDELEDEINSSERYRNNLFLLLSYKGHSTTIVTPEDFVPKEDKLKGLTICGNELEAGDEIFKLIKKRLGFSNSKAWIRLDDYTWTDDEKMVKSFLEHTVINSEIYKVDKDGDALDFVQNKKVASNVAQIILNRMTMELNDKDWFNNKLKTSFGKILFNNGYYDFKTGEFVILKEISDDIYFFEKINYDRNIVDAEYIETVRQRLFVQPLGEAVGNYYIELIARGLAGDRMKKFIMCVGSGDTGKSTLTQAKQYSCGGYFGTFNAGNLAYKDSSADEASQLRWLMLLKTKRLIDSNELKSGSIDANAMKKMSSGGIDQIVARGHGGNETETPCSSLATANMNDSCKIEPKDDALNTRLVAINYEKRYVKEVLYPDYELLADDNIGNEIMTDKFKNAFISVLANAYKNTLKDNFVDSPPNEIEIAKEEWFDVTKGGILTELWNDYEITDVADDYVTNEELRDWLVSIKSKTTVNKLKIELNKYLDLGKYVNAKAGPKKIGSKTQRVVFGLKRLLGEEIEIGGH